METGNDRPDFLLLYSVQLSTKQGLSPKARQRIKAIEALPPWHRAEDEFMKPSTLHEMLVDWTGWNEGMTYSYLEAMIHGGFEVRTLIPKERLIGYEYEVAEVKKFALFGEIQYLRSHNENEYNKVLKLRHNLLSQKKDGFDVEHELRLANKWITAFHSWFYANDIEISYTPQSAVAQKLVAKTYSEQEMANFYVNCLISNGGAEPTQTQLEEFSGVSQSNWSKRLKREGLLLLIRKKIDQVLDSEEKLIHSKATIEGKITEARSHSQVQRERTVGTGSNLKNEASLGEEDQIISDLDGEMIPKMTDADLIQAIRQLDPSYEGKDLRKFSRGELEVLYRSFV